MQNPRVILVVDDSTVDAMILARSLAKSGHKILTAHSGREAIQICHEQTPDLILMDMMMPEFDGLQTCEELKRHSATEQIPVIFVTGNTGSEDIVSAFAAGGSDYVTKPFRFDEILARLAVHLRLREAEQDLVNRNRELEILAKQLSEINETLARQSRIDGLTNLLNRRAWDEAASIEHERAVRYSRHYAVLMLDVDFFKNFNDTLGHPEGDRCLQQVADTIARTCRATDIVGRYGGEEFIVLTPDTSADESVRLAERIRRNVWNLSIRHPKSPAGRVTLSIGAASSQEGSLDEVLRWADSFLYRAKNGGRNIVYGRLSATSRSNTPVVPYNEKGTAGNAKPSLVTEAAAKVLIVEDNRANRLVYRGCLEKEGFRIHEVEDGAAAIEAVKKDRPDLILMDVMMPIMDGLECTRVLKSDPEYRDVPIIIVSARNDSQAVLAGLEAGAEEYLTKPVRTTELVTRVRSMTRLSAERRDLVRSYELRSEQIRFLTLLVDYCQRVGLAPTVEQVIDTLIETVGEITCCKRVSVMIPDSDNEFLTIMRSVGMTNEDAKDVRVRIGEGVAGRVFAAHQRVVADSEECLDGGIPRSESYLGFPMLVTPIGTSEQMLGVLNVTGRIEPRPFESREIEYVELLVGIAASAMHIVRNRLAKEDARDLVVTALARLAEHRDGDMGGHVERVTQYSCILAETLRDTRAFADVIDDAYLRNLARAVPLYDIGKVAIPDRILLKPGKLSLEEMAVMRKHVDIGAETLRPLIAKVPEADSLKMALDIIRAHHEWYDGSGYPQGLEGERIPLCARIVAVADVFDALTRDRVYEEAVSHEHARETINKLSGTQFDPVIVHAFHASMDRFLELATKPNPSKNSSLQLEDALSAALTG